MRKPSEHITEDQARIVAEHAWNATHPDDPWDEMTEARRESTTLFVHMQLRHLTPGLLAAGWMPPREVRSAANDLTGLAARVYSDELHEDKHTPAPARDGVPTNFYDGKPVDPFEEGMRALGIAVRGPFRRVVIHELREVLDSHRRAGGDCE